MERAQSSTAERDALSHNLLGQRLGRKGRDTRERIIAATERLLAEPPGTPISLSAVAREASLGMTTLYLYFSDLQELLIAVLTPIMEIAETTYIAHLRTTWPDRELGLHCMRFVEAYHAFWVKHSRVLHMRNAFADSGDERMHLYRVSASKAVIESFVQQMEGDPSANQSPPFYMATVLLTGVERMITVTTHANFRTMITHDLEPHVRNLLLAEARLVELAITDGRAAARAEAAARRA